ncbi:hypothetical protein LNR78_004387 [Salmonella enterica]|nr:hypothetical protein [Salmonella enterica]ECJ3906574.1 hypothetical protein [Salmonella enterica subsp. enterica serovar Poona]ECO1003956.1 hypothetical protein [Salmonella enterica subsp. enterica serovar Give]ECS8314095.1 hypothetical protein [Salmonella enterica subsp. enterica serovar Panama]ECT7813246.1 hypothetical protein [Salmonella enterica subsp. enterica serovar 9,12:-:1,5]ECY3797576.1 hypothetical protein [Salmonella enterica subsp. enterica serovar Minnesota]EDL3544260.1 hypot
MKKKLLSSILFVVGICSATYTLAAPVQAIATLSVTDSLSVSNDLRPAPDLVAGHTFSASDIVALGIVTSYGGDFSTMTLKWDRSINPIAKTGDPSSSILRSTDGRKQAEVRVNMDKSSTDQEEADAINDQMRYHFAPTKQASYRINVLHDGEIFAPGSYKLGVIADVAAA